MIFLHPWVALFLIMGLNLLMLMKLKNLFPVIVILCAIQAQAASTDSTVAALGPGAEVVVVHWRGWPPEAPRDAEATHRIVLDRPELVPVVEHVDADFVLLVLRRR